MGGAKRLFLMGFIFSISYFLVVFAQSLPASSNIIKIVTPQSISCYGADYPRPHYVTRAIYAEDCLNGNDP